MTQVVECLPNKSEALSSNSSTAKKKNVNYNGVQKNSKLGSLNIH
jgi:hypothetical protein